MNKQHVSLFLLALASTFLGSLFSHFMLGAGLLEFETMCVISLITTYITEAPCKCMRNNKENV